MAVSVNTIPSINVPFTDKQGRINPIWHNFLRSFVAESVAGTVSTGNAVSTVIAGNGLTATGTDNVTLNVGQGSGIAVNANDVSVDIAGQTSVQGTLDDEILISTPTNNNTIRKTRLRDIAGLSSPGGSDTHIQYNSVGAFSGDSGFTYNGSGTATLSTANVINDLTISGVTFTSANNASTSPFVFQVPAGSANPHFTFTQSGAASSSMPLDIKSTKASVYINLENQSSTGASTTTESVINFKSETTQKWCLGLTGESSGSTFTLATTGTNIGNVFTVDATNLFMAMNTALTRKTSAGNVASTTQTQGNGALTGEVNEISTCANANDTVTLPIAVAGRYCLVINNGAQTLQIFPASGDDLGAGVNASTTVAAGSRKMFVAFDSTNWEPVL